ncbi:hypothetical protein L1049_022722 [Liquidambar formosana]|uniref:Uncharacterized protein n=1 Tax=Liquidambar formosana TaxID=63359 RepID=A0AAP0WRZ1_LIQFO
MAQEHFVTSITEDHEATCWGCGLRLILPSCAPIFKCGWCGAITNQNARKRESKFFWWRRLRDRCFVCVLLIFMLFVICGGVWAGVPSCFFYQLSVWDFPLHHNHDLVCNYCFYIQPCSILVCWHATKQTMG